MTLVQLRFRGRVPEGSLHHCPARGAVRLRSVRLEPPAREVGRLLLDRDLAGTAVAVTEPVRWIDQHCVRDRYRAPRRRMARARW